MTRMLCDGFVGDNPLHMLATLGLFRIAERCAPGSRLGWHMQNKQWVPTIEIDMRSSHFLALTTQWIKTLAKIKFADPELNKKLKSKKSNLEKKKKNLTEKKKKAKDEAKKYKLKKDELNIYVSNKVFIQEEKCRLLENEIKSIIIKFSDSLGEGIAHYGDLIGVDKTVCRRRSEIAVSQYLNSKTSNAPKTNDFLFVVHQLPALGCDQIVNDEKLIPTQFSFSNGSGEQYLLKDFRTLANNFTQKHLKATLFDMPNRFVFGLTNLNWDPKANRSYALGWWDPKDKKHNPKQTDLAANVLAYIGLSLLPAVPCRGKLRSQGWDGRDSWTWPIWTPMININVVKSLLANPSLLKPFPDMKEMSMRGVVELKRTTRYDPTGKGRCYFSAPVTL